MLQLQGLHSLPVLALLPGQQGRRRLLRRRLLVVVLPARLVWQAQGLVVQGLLQRRPPGSNTSREKSSINSSSSRTVMKTWI